MSDQFALNGGYELTPIGGDPSFAPVVATPIDETVVLAKKHIDDIDLTADPAQNVNFGGVASANVVILKATGKVVAAITSADGTAQTIPFDTYLILFSESSPITAITLQRVPATLTTVKVLLGQKS